jgi:hypothetical protein
MEKINYGKKQNLPLKLFASSVCWCFVRFLDYIVGDPRDHPLWLMYHASASYTVFNEIPALDVVGQNPAVAIPPRNATHSPPKGGQRPFSSQPRLYHPYHTKPSRTTVVPTQLYHDVSTPLWQESLLCRLSSTLPSYIGWHTNDSSSL